MTEELPSCSYASWHRVQGVLISHTSSHNSFLPFYFTSTVNGVYNISSFAFLQSVSFSRRKEDRHARQTNLPSLHPLKLTSFQQNSSRLSKLWCKSALTLMHVPWPGQLHQSKKTNAQMLVQCHKRAKLAQIFTKEKTIFKLLNNFGECCWLFYPVPTCSWIWIKCTSFPAQILATSTKETSACPAQEGTHWEWTTQSSLSAWLIETFLKVSFWKNSPNCQAAHVILHL